MSSLGTVEIQQQVYTPRVSKNLDARKFNKT